MEDLIALMKTVLASAFALYLKTHSFHWNVECADFPQYHEFFKNQYEEIWASVDDIAEQIRQLDAYAPGSMDRFIQLSKVSGESGVPSPREMVLKLLHDNEIMIVLLTEACNMATKENKQGLANFLAARLEAHNKHRWMLRATAKKYKGVE